MTTPSERKAANDRKRLEKAFARHASGCWERLDLARFADLLEAGEEVIVCEHCGGVLYDAHAMEKLHALRETATEAGIDHRDMSSQAIQELFE